MLTPFPLSISGACNRCRKAKRKCALTKEDTETKTGKWKDREEVEEGAKKRSRAEARKERSRTEERRPETGAEWRVRIERRLKEMERRMEEGFRRVIDEIRREEKTEDEDVEGDDE